MIPAMTAEAPAQAYRATVVHRSHRAPQYRFRYTLSYWLIDIDRLPELAVGLRHFGLNRFNWISFHEQDHGARRIGELRRWAEQQLASRGIELAGGRIRLLCLPRVLGHAFNPLSLWYCEHADGSLRAVIAEVRNTFGQRHCYLLARGGAPLAAAETLETEKIFHVSPFLELGGRYRFRLAAPDSRLKLAIHEYHNGQPVLDAWLAGQREPIDDRRILGQVLRRPWMNLSVLAGIHWQALKIWLRGARLYPKPPLPPTPLS